jgi:hypothetical protein
VRDDAGHIPTSGTLNFERRVLRDEFGAIAQRLQPRLHEIRAEIQKQQEAAQQREGGEKERREESDEDVRDQQLPADAPQQTPFGEQDELDEEVADADRRRQPRHAIDDAEERRLGAEQDAGRQHGELERDADHNHASRQRVEQRASHARATIDRQSRHGLRDIKTCIVTGS